MFHRAQFFNSEQSGSGNSDTVTVYAAHQWNKAISERIVGIPFNFKSKIQIVCVEKNYRAEERCVGKDWFSREERQGFCCFLNPDIRIFRTQSDATRKGLELAAEIVNGGLRWVALFLLHRSQHQMLGSKCAFCTHRDHSDRPSTSNFMAHQVNKPAEETFMVCRTVIIYNSKHKAVA